MVEVWRQAARRLALIYGALLVGTAAIAGLIGVAAGDVQRAIAIGYYVSGVVLLAGCFVMGARGPLRGVSDTGEPVSLLGARRVRRATAGERSESSRIAILLFVLGISLVVLGSLFDPAHSTF